MSGCTSEKGCQFSARRNTGVRFQSTRGLCGWRQHVPRKGSMSTRKPFSPEFKREAVQL
jgi:hypothetical protein